MPQQNEKRRLKRRHLFFYLRVVDLDSDQIIGYLVNITTEGIMLMSDFPIAPGKEFRFRMLVDSTLDEKKYLEFKARSCWCKKSVNTDFYDTGFELLDVQPALFKDIERMIEELGFVD